MISPAIILVRPQLGENIGMVARAMLNCGVRDLRVVSPRDGWPNAAALASAAKAVSVVEQAQVFDTVDGAIADLCALYATTCRRRFMQKPSVPFLEVPKRLTQHEGRAGVMFGAESSGLSNDDVVLADALIHIPVDPVCPSLNLAQAVYAICHPYYVAMAGAEFHDEMTLEAPAPKEELMAFYYHLESALDQAGFLKPAHKRAKMVQNLRNLFQKASPTSQEVRTLRGVVRALTLTHHSPDE